MSPLIDEENARFQLVFSESKDDFPGVLDSSRGSLSRTLALDVSLQVKLSSPGKLPLCSGVGGRQSTGVAAASLCQGTFPGSFPLRSDRPAGLELPVVDPGGLSAPQLGESPSSSIAA